MARTDNLDHFLTDVADAIRTKTGSAAAITASQFDVAITNIPSGGGSPTDYFDGNGAHYTDAQTNFFKVDYVIDTTNFPDIDCTGYTSLQSFFSNCLWKKLPRVKNTTAVTNMQEMFNSCLFVQSLDLSQINTASVTNMTRMFYSCMSLTSLDLSGFDFTNVTNMTNMFAGCTNLTSLNLGTSNTPNLTGAEYLFQNIANLTSIDLSHFDLSQLPSAMYMFATTAGNPSLQTITLPTPDTNRFFGSTLRNIQYMFDGQKNLTTVNNLADLPWSGMTNVAYAFRNCTELVFPDPFVIDASSLASIANMFASCYKLKNVTINHIKQDLYIERAFGTCFKTFTSPEITIKFVADDPTDPKTVQLTNNPVFNRAFDNTLVGRETQKLVLEFDHMKITKGSTSTSSTYQIFGNSYITDLVFKNAIIGPSFNRMIGYALYLTNLKFDNCDFSELTQMNSTFDPTSANLYTTLKTLEIPGLTGVGITFTNAFQNLKGLTKLDIRDMLFSGGVNTSILGNDIPNDCLIIVKDATEKAALQTGMPRFTNIMTVAEYEAS